jgi:predicted transcriptional regulator
MSKRLRVKTEVLQVRLSRESKEKVQSIAEKEDVPMSVVLDTLIKQAKEPSMSKKEVEAWTFAISRRIVDMIPSDDLDSEDRELLCKTLDKALIAVPKEMSKLIGTGIIEESYFD